MNLYRYSWLALTLLLFTIGCAGLMSPDATEEPPANDQLVAAQRPMNENIVIISNNLDPVVSGVARQDPTATPLPPVTIDQARAVEEVLINIYARVNPSVVNIEVVDERSVSDVIDSSGSGFVFDTDGHIVTNAHVVLGAREILVTFPQGLVVEAELVGYDIFSDLAVIRVDVEPSQLQPVVMGDSSTVRVGQYTVAIGNPFGLQSSMTTGIVSAIGRTLPSQALINPLTQEVYSNPAIIQIDAAVNPGNSGGPVLNLAGEVIGVATAIRSETGVFQGVAYAVPANTVKRIIPQLIATGSAEYSWLGVQTVDASEPGLSMPALSTTLNLPVNYGVLIEAVQPNSPAEAAGLLGGTQPVDVRGFRVDIGGDIIIAINGQDVEDLDELLQYLVENTSPGDTITLTVVRDTQILDVPVVLGTRPTND